MKTETSLIETMFYICESCERKYPCESTARWCESNHIQQACQHTNLDYDIITEDNYGSIDIYLTGWCRDCKKDDVYRASLNYLDNEVLEKFAKILKEGGEAT